MTDSRDELALARAWAAEGRRVALATVIETWGSAPRPIGSRLLIDADGNFAGSVSGGCVEGEVVSEALDTLADGRPRLLSFGVADATAWRVGLSCGGRIRVHVRALAAADLGRIAAALDDRAARRPFALVTDLESGDERLVRSDGLAGDPLAADIAAALAARGARLVADGTRELFIAADRPPCRLVAIGAVHISQAMIPFARPLGLELHIVDPRTAFATPERFPGVPLHADWPETVLPALALDADTALAALTHDPRIDDPALRAALAAGCFYVGALGSRRTHARRLERLAALGVSALALGRIRAPIGLDLGGRSPAEIALATVAEVVAARNGRLDDRRERPALDLAS